jgi:O-antigen ligase
VINAKQISSVPSSLFLALGLLTALCFSAGLYLEEPIILALPFALLFGFFTVMNFRPVYLLMLVSLSISVEVYFSPTLGTDLPSEPLIVGLTLVYLLYILKNPAELKTNFLFHPVILLLLLHLAWIFYSSFFSGQPIVSLKFSIAKTWYILTFVFLTALLIRSEDDISQFFWWLFTPLVLVTTRIILVHWTYDFGFMEINSAVQPFFRNHVNYSAILVLVMPWAVTYLFRYKRMSAPWLFILFGIAVMFFGILTAYTRAAYVALFLIGAAYVAIRLRLMRLALAGAAIVIIGVVVFLVRGNQFMEYAPSERTITHGNLSEIVAATSSFEDASTMERYYRWIAAGRMIQDRPWMGYGPGNFYFFYKKYTLNTFTTYVSNNPERSGVHNYFLMTLVDQGIIGLVIFLLFTVGTLLIGENIYHRIKDPRKRDVVAMAIITVVGVDAFLLINDLIESDKVGSLYFISIAIMVKMDLLDKQAKS